MSRFEGTKVAGWVVAGLAGILGGVLAGTMPNQERVTLLGTLADWQYPGSKWLPGASMSDGGNPLIQDVNCQAVLTTADPFEKVVAYYAKKLAPEAGEAAAPEVEAQAVWTQDDSQGRPVRVRVITVNKAQSSTTLVISRTEGERETHIAWTHYLRLDGKP